MSKTIILIKNNIRAYVSDVTDVAQKAISMHNTYPLASLALGSAIGAFTPLGVMKQNDLTTAYIKANGPLKNIIVESNDKGDVRALVGNPNVFTEYDKENFNLIPIELGIGSEGILKITRKIQNEVFGSDVFLQKGNISTDLSYFFHQSEQIFSAVQLSTVLENPSKFKKVFSVIFQLLPDHDDKDIEMIETIIKEKPLLNFDDIEKYINEIYFQKLDVKELRWKCTCSDQKIMQTAKLISLKERKEIIKEQCKLELTCNFCNKKYDITNKLV